MEQIIYNITKLFYFFLYFFIILLVLVILFHFVLKNFNPYGKKIKIYGLFLGLGNKEILSLSITTVHYVFFLWCLFANNFERIYQDIYFYILLFSSISFNLLNRRYLNIFTDIINTIIIYIALYTKMIFIEYLITIDILWYVILIVVLLMIFIIIYGSYLYIKDIEYLLKKNKYVKKKIERKKVV